MARDTGDLEIDLDHRGRSQPLFAPRSVRPKTQGPPVLLDLALGLFPGARMMARGRVAEGLGYLILGLFCLLVAGIMLAGWSTRAATMISLAISPKWQLLHATVAFVSITLYEILRMVSSMDLTRGHLRVTRALASLAAPSLVVLLGAPDLVAHAPAPIEGLWLASVLGAAVALVAAFDCVRTRSEDEASGGVKLALGGAAITLILLAIGVGMLKLDASTNESIAHAAAEAGFRLVPKLLAWIG